jgi:hypothetical protein
MEYTTRGRFGGLGLKTMWRTFFMFEPQNPDRGSEEEQGSTWRNNRGCVKVKQICVGSMVVRSIEIELDHSALRLGASLIKYLGANG